MDGTKARAGDAALGANDGKDAKFAGNSLEVDGIFPAASKRVGDPLPQEQGRAARLIAWFLDEAAVDEALDLPAGTVKRWMKGETFRERVAEERRLSSSTAPRTRTSEGSSAPSSKTPPECGVSMGCPRLRSLVPSR